MSTQKVVGLPRRTVASVSPLSGELLREFEQHSDDAVESKIALAATAFREYRKIPFAQRAAWMLRAAEILESEKDMFGRLMTQEMGKTLKSAVQEAEKSAFGCRYYAENAERFLADEEAKTNAARSFIRYQPIGPVLALMAGNVGLLKHASNVPQCALAIEDIFRRAGFPEGAFQTLLIGPDRVNHVIADRRIAAVTLTGSVGAGISVATQAGKELKKSVLELGGSDPFIVMPSADLDRAAETAVQARVINNGQSCIAAKRFIVHQRIAEQFEKKFVARMASLKVGDPMDPNTDVGPLATADVLQGLEKQVQETIKMGARVLLGASGWTAKEISLRPRCWRIFPKVLR